MTADVQRELAEALAEIVATHTPDLIHEGPNGEDDGQHLYCVEDGVLPVDQHGLQYGPLHVAEKLLPTVQALIADAEKRAAAAALREVARQMDVAPTTRVPLGETAEKLRDRAAALEPAGADSGEGR